MSDNPKSQTTAHGYVHEMSPDRQMQHDVQAELAWQPGMNTAHIGVAAERGVVTLTGHVGDVAHHLAAAMAAGQVNGVKQVVNDLRIEPFMSGEAAGGATETPEVVNVSFISDCIMHEEGKSWFFDQPTVFVTAHGSEVRLSGHSSTWQHRLGAEAEAWRTGSVTKVDNAIVID